MTDTKPRVEVQQESTERLEVLALERTPRPEKLARETALLEGASEVAFRERAFRPRHPAGIDEVRAAVDALVVQRRALPDVPALPELPPAPAPQRPIDPRLRAALEPVVPAPLVAVEPVFSSAAGEVVDAYWEEDGARRSRQFLVKDDVATPVEDVSSRIDALPAPKAPAPAPAPAAPSSPAEEPKKRKLGLPFGKKKEKAEAAEPAPEPEPAAEEKPEKKRRFGFGKK